MKVDEVLADLRAALGLTEDEPLLNVIVIGEYVSLDPNADHPEHRRLAYAISDEINPWTSIGMLEHCLFVEQVAIGERFDRDDDG